MSPLIRVCTLGLVALLVATSAYSQAERSTRRERRERRERTIDRGRELIEQARQIRRTRGVTRRVLHDRRATPAMKEQASELAALLDRRQALLDGLQAAHRDFLAQHGVELAELDEIQERARVLRERLETARSQLVNASASQISELKTSSKRAAELAEDLRAAYFRERRERRMQRR